MVFETAFAIDAARTVDRDDAIAICFDKEEQCFYLSVFVTDLTGVALSTWQEMDALLSGFTEYRAGNIRKPMLPYNIVSYHSLDKANCPVFEIQVKTDVFGAVVEDSFFVCRRFIDVEVVAYEQVCEDFRFDAYHRFAKARLSLRERLGARQYYDLVKGEARTEEGKIIKLEKQDNNSGYLLVAECMILTNYLISKFAFGKGLDFIHRTHGEKDVDYYQADYLPHALYNVKSGFHAGLNLDYYCHFTSPLRRYSDLVNQRQLKSFLERRKGPYTWQHLSSLGEHLTRRQIETREEKTDHFKSLQEKRLIGYTYTDVSREVKTKEVEDLVRMSDRSFYRVLRLSQGKSLSASVVEALEKRVELNLMTPLDAMVLLFDRKECYHLVGKYIEENPGNSARVWILAKDKGRITALPETVFKEEDVTVCNEKGKKEITSKMYYARCLFDGQSASSQDKSKKTARFEALKKLMFKRMINVGERLELEVEG